MPLITPCPPRLCATHAVCKSTLAVLKAEIARAHEICARAALQRDARDGSRAATSAAHFEVRNEWAPLFAPLDMFGLYPSFVQVIEAPTRDAATRNAAPVPQRRAATGDAAPEPRHDRQRLHARTVVSLFHARDALFCPPPPSSALLRPPLPSSTLLHPTPSSARRCN